MKDVGNGLAVGDAVHRDRRVPVLVGVIIQGQDVPNHARRHKTGVVARDGRFRDGRVVVVHVVEYVPKSIERFRRIVLVRR